MAERPKLHLVDTATGEVVADDRDVLIDQLTRTIHGQATQIGKLRKENASLRLLEPEAEKIMGVLEYWRPLCKPRADIAVGGARWEAVRARLRDRLDGRPPWTPEELCLAVDGALLDPFWNGTLPKSKGKSYVLEASSIFAKPERVEQFRDLAIGFKAKTGVHLRDLIDVAEELRVVNWRFLLRACGCGHRRIEHARGDPDHEGQERCFECECLDFYEDPLEGLNWKGKDAA